MAFVAGVVGVIIWGVKSGVFELSDKDSHGGHSKRGAIEQVADLRGGTLSR